MAHGPAATHEMLRGVESAEFPVQVRHGAPLPYDILRTLAEAGLTATEGGPVSYCLPYGRTPLRDSVRAWRGACEMLASHDGGAGPVHMESFGGCLLGQLCPPGLLVAVTLLEGLFFRQAGIRSVSLSYAQQTNPRQDTEAVSVLRELAGEYLADTDWHVVIYTYMGVYPRTRAGAANLLRQSAGLAVRTGAERLIVKTEVEAYRIPTIAENVRALEIAEEAAAEERSLLGASAPPAAPRDTGIGAESRALVEAVLSLDADIGTALVKAFERGLLDVPYCLHADNHGRARSYIDEEGRLGWVDTGRMPITGSVRTGAPERIGADHLLNMLSFVERRFDEPELAKRASRRHDGLAP
ncbi:methylaspartate mutase [Streptomyces sudanensis]|uniref:methylaspartate mutase n=2 Tax=Streptomyces sudanensis TaxID=436397 RepID=UPI0027E4105B|nr:methylaspartate mutase [Streptomyces sudanensis]